MSSMPNIPPAILYAFGLIIAVMGGLRAYHLGWRRRPAGPEAAEGPELPEGEAVAAELASDGAPGEDAAKPPGWSRAQGGGYKRHITMGLLWVAMGLFLIISTALNNR
jgi:hypothetical protein